MTIRGNQHDKKIKLTMQSMTGHSWKNYRDILQMGNTSQRTSSKYEDYGARLAIETEETRSGPNL